MTERVGDEMPVRKEEVESSRYLSYAALMRIRFLKNRMAVLGGLVILLMYLVMVPAEFTAPYASNMRNREATNAPPQRIRFVDADGSFSLRPFVYGYTQTMDMFTFQRVHTVDESKKYPIKLFVRSEPRSFLGLTITRRLIGVEDGYIHLLGTDSQGRDVLSRTIYGGRVSLTVGFVGVGISLVIGTILGVLSGYVGGVTDTFIQRGIEVLMGFPNIPLWMALSAAVPDYWNPLQIFFVMSLILSLIGWGGLARVVRGMTLSLKSEEYVTAARLNGGNTWWVLSQHLVPANFSYIVVSLTLSIPAMIIGETALSFLGLGIQAPMVSWGALLQAAQDVNIMANQPWVLSPAIPVIVSVLAFNFVGDGARDAADPLSSR